MTMPSSIAESAGPPPATATAARTRRASLASLAAALLLGGCAGPDPAQGLVVAEGVETRRVAVGDADAVPDVVAATRRVGAAMLAAAPPDSNAVASPSGLTVALSMLADGARGDTRGELEQVLGATGDDRRDAVAAVRGALLAFDGDPGVVRDKKLPETPVVHVATQVVVDDRLTPDDAYLRTLAGVYGAGLQHVDLGSGTGRSALDDWVRFHSGGLVERSAIVPQEALRVVLQDAVVLAAAWQTPFPGYGTADRPFTLAGGAVVSVPTMATEVWGAYAEVDGWRAVRLPYAGEELHADLVLPPQGIDPATAHPDLIARIAEQLGHAATQPVRVALPTLDLRPEPLDLTTTIAALGAPGVLDPARADLTGVGADQAGGRLYLAQAKQQTVLQVDEQGTRAAAVTELGGEAGAAPSEDPVEVVLDRPFRVEIAHTATSWPLFEAAVRDPRP